MDKSFNSFLKKYKHTHKCILCGENADCCLEFHHIIPKEKSFSLRSINESKYSKEELIKEVNKTCLLCSNCHRKLHNKILQVSNEELLEKKVNVKDY